MSKSNVLLVALAALLGLEAAGIGVMAAKVTDARRTEAEARAEVSRWQDYEAAEVAMLTAELANARRRDGGTS